MMATDEPASWYVTFTLGAGVGCLAGLLIGIIAVVAIAGTWLFWLQESSENPLARLSIPEGALTLPQTQTYVDQLANEHLQSTTNAGLVVALIRDDQVRVTGYGETKRGSGVKPGGETVFEIASVGKTLTATLLAHMVVTDEIALDDPVADYVPQPAAIPALDGRPITLLDLATHSSGLPSLPPNFTGGQDPLNPYKDYTVDEMFTGLSQIKLERPPGARYEYSNVGYGLLGYALAHHAKTDFERLVIERIAQPLQMTQTRMTLDAEMRQRLATPHDHGKPVPVWEDTTMPGAGSFLSTANDLVRFLRAHWEELPEEHRALDQALDMTTQKYRRGDSAPQAVGLGWHITSENALDIIWHNGAAGGSTSYVAMLPRKKLGVIVLSNSSSPVDELGYQLLYLLAWH